MSALGGTWQRRNRPEAANHVDVTMRDFSRLIIRYSGGSLAARNKPIHAFSYTALNEVRRERMMTEHNARRLAFAGASLITSLILLCVMLNLTFPEESSYRNGFGVCLGLLFLYVRAVPKKIWVPD